MMKAAVLVLVSVQQPAGFMSVGTDAEAAWSYASAVREDPTNGDLLTRIAATYPSPIHLGSGPAVSYSIWPVDIDCNGQIGWAPGSDYAADGSAIGRAPDRPTVLRQNAPSGVRSVVDRICQDGATDD